MAEEKIVNGVHKATAEEMYEKPDNALVNEHIEWFSGLKLGFMMHWAPVVQLGITESWPLSDGNRTWSQYEIDWTDDIEEFKRQYWALNKTFNPIKFSPKKWAALAKECGFKYLLFTTKHHDGFCMYDTKETDYKITAPDCPFSTNPRADIVKEMFNAFRDEGLGISAYYSKADWHSNDYWHREFGNPPTSNMNYKIEEHPELWENFVKFVHAQFLELTSDYGKIDALWLDGGWVRADNRGQDLRLGEIVEKIRSTTQPHLIVCDRTVGGKYENIVTPEQELPEKALNIPWESCITLGHDFSFHYDDEPKTAHEIIHTFIETISKGGNLALNITPQPDGDLPKKAVHVLRQIGAWVNTNAEGIYNTHASDFKPFRSLRFTQRGNVQYAFNLYKELPFLPPYIQIKSTGKVVSVKLLRTGETIPFKQNSEVIELDTSGANRMNMEYADCFAITFEE